MKKEQLSEIASGTFGGVFLGSYYGVTGIVILGVIGGVTCFFASKSRINRIKKAN
jgi:hypothetical protein